MLRESSGDLPQTAQGHERLILLILASVQFTTIVDFMIVMPLGPQLMRTLGVGTAEFGLIVSSYTFAAGVAGLVASSVVDRFARRSTFLILYAGFLLGTLLCALATSYYALVLARIATGAFGGILGGMAMTIIGDVFPENRRGRANRLTDGGVFVRYGCRRAVRTLSGNELRLASPVLRSRGDRTAGPGADAVCAATTGRPRSPHACSSLSFAGSSLSEPNHLNAFALIVVLMLAGFSVFPYISAYFVANLELPETQLPLIFIVGGAVTLISTPIIGRLADRYGKLRVYRIITPFSALLFLAVTHLPPVSVATIVTVYGALMVCNVGPNDRGPWL